MKKFNLIVVSLLLTLVSYSQNFSRVIKATKSEFANDKWNIVETQYPTDLFIILKDWDVTIGTYKFKTYDNNEKTYYDTHLAITWKCINPDGEKCYFIMKKFKPEITTHIVYSLVYEQYLTMYEYETE